MKPVKEPTPPKQLIRLKPIGDRVLIRPVNKGDVTESGIVLPQGVDVGDLERIGTVAAIGDGESLVEPDIKAKYLALVPGTPVYYFLGMAVPVNVNGEKLLMLSYAQLLGTVEFLPPAAPAIEAA